MAETGMSTPAWHRRRGLPGGKLPALALIAAIVVAALTLTALRLGGNGGPQGRCQEVFVPAFFSPGRAWTQAIRSTPRPATMILDVSNGAGSAPDLGLQAVVKQAQAAGITVLGYTDTSYGNRPAAAAEADVQHYKAWYRVTDIFLDQAATGSAQLGYYRNLAAYIRRLNPGATIWLNPGSYPEQGYMSVGNVVMVFEGPYASYVHMSVPSWVSHYPAARFAHTIYTTPGSELTSAIRLSRSRNAGHVYITDRSGANPYSGLPGYWSREDRAATAICPPT